MIPKRVSLCWLCASVAAAAPASALELTGYSGVERDTHAQGYAYVGADLFKTTASVWQPGLRVGVNELDYRYFSGTTLIKASAPGGSALAGLRYHVGEFTAGLFGGVDVRQTNLTPDSPDAPVRGLEANGVVQGQADYWFRTRTNLNLFTSFSGISDFVYEKARIRQQVTNFGFPRPLTINVGLEQIYGSNVDYTQEGGGALLEFYVIPWATCITLHGGYKHDSTFGAGGYAGLELSKRFL